LLEISKECSLTYDVTLLAATGVDEFFTIDNWFNSACKTVENKVATDEVFATLRLQ